MRVLTVTVILLLIVSVACAEGDFSFSIVTSTGSVPITGMASYNVAESGDWSAWADIMYLPGEDAFALGLSGRHAALNDIIPLVKGGGVCAYWSFRYDCIKARLYLINVSF